MKEPFIKSEGFFYYIRSWCSGNILFSKTKVKGSIPLERAKYGYRTRESRITVLHPAVTRTF
jgi:hypothetical protein